MTGLPRDDQPVLVNDREQLIYLLTEAAEIEHGLMCSYLYAGWSLKQKVDEGITAEQLRAVNEWRARIQGVAMEEMLHLALVSNLLTSIGSPPHFSRSNFPVAPGYHPSSVVVRLTPFDRDTADHFVYLERPEGQQSPQAKGFESEIQYARGANPMQLTPTAADYATISHLYRGIEDGFRHLAQSLGEDQLFLGKREAQVDNSILALDGLCAVTDLDSAVIAINTIIEQGEGGRGDEEESHYRHFLAIRDEYDTFLQQDLGFVPHRPVVSDPVMHAPILPQGQRHISASRAATVLDLANASYGLMLRLLASGFGLASGSTTTRRIEIDSAIGIMQVVKSLSVLLTTLPADDSGQTAGMSFYLPRLTLALPQPHAGARLLGERANEIAKRLEAAAEDMPQLDRSLAGRLTQIAANLQRLPQTQLS